MAEFEYGRAETLRRIEEAARTGATELNLSALKLSELSGEIGKLTELTELNLFGNQLTSLPAEIGKLTELTELNLFGNRLTSLPAEIVKLTKLTELNFSHNQFTMLPAEIGELTELAELNLSHNQFTMLPAEIGELTELTELNLFGNRLTLLPAEIGKLTKLTELNLFGNRLTSLPAEIGKLTELTELNLSHNQLTSLPAEIGKLTNLTRLDLGRNQLTTLPAEIVKLTKLKELYLHDNPGLDIPPEILGPTWLGILGKDTKAAEPHGILDYYFRISGGEGRSLDECKVIVVGRGGAGKTSLVKRLNGEKWDPNEPETHGITIRKLSFDCRSGTVTGRVWDFGGQVVLHSMHEFFLTARSLYLLVLGERDDMLERDAAYWLQLIRSYAGNAPVVVAMNKSAGRQRHFDRATLAKDYGPILAWVATECSEEDREGSGIAALGRELVAALDGPLMKSIHDKFPGKWFAVKDELEDMAESYLDYPQFVKRCIKYGVHDEQSQTMLAARLHELGVAMNYSDDCRLRDTSVLKPNWLANGIYAVLRANDVDQKMPKEIGKALACDGVITAELMGRIHRKAEAWDMLRAADYPAEKREFLLRLMDLFHLSYPLDGKDGKHLVPSLLPLHPPEGAKEPAASAERVRLRYEFQVVPAPLIPGFIARIFSLIPDRLHWRRGAVVVFGQSRGLVWTTQDERYVYVTVSGAEEDRADLLTMVRGTFSELFHSYRGLAVTEQWEYGNEWVPRRTLERFGKLEPDEPEEIDRVIDGEELVEEGQQ